MYLISTEDFSLKQFYDSRSLPPYVVLSHCWGDVEDEISLQAFREGSFDRNSLGWKKISACCTLARKDGIGFAWVDTCCIDKTSSAELTEAINSMFMWYSLSVECYVFLPDVTDVPSKTSDNPTSLSPTGVNSFLGSRWFRRGWTLQELLAPSKVTFFNMEFQVLGSKQSLSSLIVRATGIDSGYLDGRKSITEASVATRMYWASGRSTQRIEDEAYCLLGIFNVHMPLIYGEGNKAFHRLQAKIMQRSGDESIFTWGCDDLQSTFTGMLASSPHSFSASKDIADFRKLPTTRDSTFELTNKGICYHYPLFGPIAKPKWVMQAPTYRSIQLSCKDRKNHERIVLKVVRIENQWYRATMWRYRPSFLEKHLHLLSAILLPYRRIYLVTAAMDDDFDGLDEDGAQKPSAMFTPMTLYRLAVTIALTVSVITLSISKGDLYFLLRIALLQMAIDIAPMEARIVLPPIGVLLGLTVDLYLQGFFTTSLFPG